MQLKFRYSNLVFFRLVEFDNKTYILDATSSKGKSYHFGALPKEVSIEMVELSPSNTHFKIRPRPPVATTTLALAVQPLVRLMTRVMESVFLSLGLSQQTILKLLVFAFAELLVYLAVVLYKNYEIATFRSRIPQNSKRYRLVLEPNGKRMLDWPLVFVVNLLCLAIFLNVQNGTEGAVLVVNGILSFFLFAAMKMSLVPVNYGKTLFLTRIEEVR